MHTSRVLEQFKEIIYLCTLFEQNESMKGGQNAPVSCQVIQCEINLPPLLVVFRDSSNASKTKQMNSCISRSV